MKRKTGYFLGIGWLYPDYMSTYGDRGNITVMTKRLQWRGIGCGVLRVGFETTVAELEKCDLILGGGAQDRQQTLMIDDLRNNKAPVLKRLFERGVPGLFVCGAPQLLGHSYMTGDGRVLKGLGIFDMESRHFGKSKPRLIGNLLALISDSFRLPDLPFRQTVVGFENHGGRTYLGPKVKPFGQVVYGAGNNGEDKSEGAVFKNCIATYSHGPFLSKNPHIADWILYQALRVKYGKDAPKLTPLDDTLEWQAHSHMVRQLGEGYEELLP